MSALPDGLYDLLVTHGLARRLRDDQSRLAEPRGAATAALLDLLGQQLGRILDDLGAGDDGQLRQLEFVNGLLAGARERLRAAGRADDADALVDPPAEPLRQLRAVSRAGRFPEPPELGLAAPWLFTAGKGNPSLLNEPRHELASADRIDVLVSFIKTQGVRKIADILARATAVGADGRPPLRLRILTTTYLGATEADALDQLARLPGCELRVSLDGRRTRLHAKAWLFGRATGFGTAYVGSANLSAAALTGGLEWTVKFTQHGQAALYERARTHFEALWADGEFQPYHPDRPDEHAALREALARERGASGGPARDDDRVIALSGFFSLDPKPYQQEMLDALAVERAHGRRRNLVVAATGTGKTVVAAFDYRATCRAEGGRPRLLFVAHRAEILRQALRTYREVLRDGSFGQLLDGAHRPDSFDHLFATIDSLASQNLVARLGGDYWHSVVIDECHRLGGERFDALARAIRPRLLLGLTATPERADGKPIAPHFDMRPDGSPAVELRLWHALDLQLLAPFEYYACDDDTDFSAVPWQQPGEAAALDRLVSANDVRARLVLREWARLSGNPRAGRAIVFCVSVAHARFMTGKLNAAGLPALCLTADTPADERRRAPQLLDSGEVCALVTVDLFNEGVDLPFVDTLLLLRPTQSPVLFQQQIGRGLRLHPAKESCLVLDFVGQHRREFRFDRLLGSLTGLSRRALTEAVDEGFGQLPPGCHINLQRQTRDQVLRSLRAITSRRWNSLCAELQAHVALRGRDRLRLADFLREQCIEPGEVWRDIGGASASGWTSLKRDAGLLVAEPGPEEAYLSRRAADLLHADDSTRLALWAVLPALVRAAGGSSSAEAAPDMSVGSDEAARDARADAITAAQPHVARTALQMLAYQLDGDSRALSSPADLLARLARNPGIADDLAELAELLETTRPPQSAPLPGLDDTPLRLHASYGIREILTAVGAFTATRRFPFQAGVHRIESRRVELLFVTLDKSEGFHDAIAYRDHALTPDRFHWQSQNSAGPDTPAGRRYLESPGNGWQFQLFVRGRKGEAYCACGPVQLESAEGERPMSIVWRLSTPLPARLFRQFSVLHR